MLPGSRRPELHGCLQRRSRLPGSRRPELPGCPQREGVTQLCIPSSSWPAPACLGHDDLMRETVLDTV